MDIFQKENFDLVLWKRKFADGHGVLYLGFFGSIETVKTALSTLECCENGISSLTRGWFTHFISLLEPLYVLFDDFTSRISSIMTTSIAKRLEELGIELPDAAAPVANYVPFCRAGTLVFISGQLPLENGSLLYTGLVGDTVEAGDAVKAARQCAINIIAQLQSACGGDLDRVQRIVKIGGFVAARPDFTDYPIIINGASDLMVDVFGERGRHARAAVGCPSLPLNAPVEIEAIASIS